MCLWDFLKFGMRSVQHSCDLEGFDSLQFCRNDFPVLDKWSVLCLGKSEGWWLVPTSWSGLHWRNTLPSGRDGRGLLLIRESVEGVQRRVAGVNSDFKYWDAKEVSRRIVCVCGHCDPEDWSLPGSSFHGIFQARILEQVAISYSKDLPDTGIKPVSLASPALARGFFTNCATWEAQKGSTWC